VGEEGNSGGGNRNLRFFGRRRIRHQADSRGKALAGAGCDWPHKKGQFVIGTRNIDGTPGMAHVLGTYFW